MLVGNLLALRQQLLPRMLGYSTIAHSGYIAMILASGAPGTGEAVLFYLGIYAPALTATLCASAMLGPAPMLEDLRGLARKRPLEATSLSVGLLSLAGLPVAGGFVAKLYLFKALVQSESWILLAIAMVGAALGFYYYIRFFTAPFFGHGGIEPAPRHRFDRLLLIFCFGLIMLFGFEPLVLITAVNSALAVR